MKYCKICALKVNTHVDHCPLCAATISEIDSDCNTTDTQACNHAQPDYSIYPPKSEGIKYNLTFRIFLFLSIVAVAVCGLINILSYDGYLWSLIVLGSVGFGWAAVGYPLIVRKNIGHHVMVDAIALCLYFIMTRFVMKSAGWSLDYVIPFMFIASTTFISLIILIRHMKWREYALYQFVTIILGLLPVISVIAGLVESIWPSIGSALYSFVTLLGMLIFADKKYKNELIKRFHF